MIMMSKKECLQELHRRTGGEKTYCVQETHWKMSHLDKPHVSKQVSQFITDDQCINGYGATWEECLDDLAKRVDVELKSEISKAKSLLEACGEVA